MKESKNAVVIFTMVSVISTGTLMIVEYGSNSIKTIVGNILPFVIDHGDLWNNILIGIVSSSILMFFSTVNMYFVQRNCIDLEIKYIYLDMKQAILKYMSDPDKNGEFLYEKSIEYWDRSCRYDRDDKPFVIIRRQHVINKQVHKMSEKMVSLSGIYYFDNEKGSDWLVEQIELLDEKFDFIRVFYKIEVPAYEAEESIIVAEN